MKDSKKPIKEEAEVHEDLKGFDIKVDSFGNIKSNMDIERIKKFLDRKVDDKKVHNIEEE